MNLNEDEIYFSLESYRNKMGYSQEKMAEIVGLATKQTYRNMINNKTMKFSYFINLINNTGLSSDYFLPIETRKEPQGRKEYNNDEQVNLSAEAKVTRYSCPDCIEKENTIKDLRANLNDLRKHIDFLEFSLGKKKKTS